jgi:NAD+ kinase
MGEVACDGMVCSSATGSTGYNLANGGPVLPPEFRGFVVTAVAPHLTWFHTLVLPEDADCRLSAVSTGGVVLTADGQVDVPVQPEQHVHVTVSPTSLIFARTRPLSEFYATFRSRLQLPQ